MGPNRASGLLDAIQRVAPLIRERRDEFDKLRRLPDDIFETLAAAGLFRLWLPQAIGGPELSPFEFMSVVEAASALDGSVGWLVGNGGGMSRVGGYASKAVARDWFSDRRAFVAAATGAVGTATRVEGGYRVAGRWPFGSGAHHASLFMALAAHMVRVYNYMASGLALSGIVAFGLFSSAELASLFFEVQARRVVGLNVLGWIAIFAPLGLLMLTSFRAAQMSTGAVQAVYWAVTALMGVSLSLLLFTYTGASVARTFFVTAAAFGALSLYGYTTKRDLTAMGKFLFMGVIGLILAGLVNMIWPSGTMSFIISAAGVLIFSGLIAYDTQKIKEQYAEAWGTDTAEKVAIFGALSLYLDFVNLFQFLMSFLGQERE